MYKISVKQEQNFKQVQLYNDFTDEYLLIAPDFGANLNALALKAGDTLISLLDGNDKSEEFEGRNLFKGGKLFPFPNRIKDGKYIFEGKTHQLPVNFPEENNACHGFVFDKNFIINDLKEGPDGATASFSYIYNGDLDGYPFPFTLEIAYGLSDNGMTCHTHLKNKLDRSIPVGDGWHPYIALDKKINGFYLRFPSSHILEVDEKLIPSGKTSPYHLYNNFRKIDDAIFDSCFQLHASAAGIQTTELYDPDQKVTIHLWQETGRNKYNYLQIYTPADRGSIAIEPMTCSANAFNDNNGLIVLPPEAVFEAKFGIKLSHGDMNKEIT